jgi:hypothetical protein
MTEFEERENYHGPDGMKENKQFKRFSSYERDILGCVRIDSTIPILARVLEIVENLQERMDKLEDAILE